MKTYPTDLTDSQWQFIEKIVNTQRKRKHPLRAIWNALLYLIKTGCQWRMLSGDFPHWSAVYYYFKKWKLEGLFEEVLDKLNEKRKKATAQKSTP